MRALVVHESLTGNTREAAHRIVAELRELGWNASECSAAEFDLGALQAADVLVLGTWVDGLLLVGQRPGGNRRLSRLPLLGDTPTYLYVTYAVDPGRTLEKLTETVMLRHGDVRGGMAIRRGELAAGSVEFARRVVAAAERDAVAR
jgi:hypothetical protein